MRRLLACLAVLSICGGAVAQTRPQTPVLDDPDAFERGLALSFYRFDACGDPLAGRMFRRALADKFAHCAFSDAARSRYRDRARAQQARSQQLIQGMIESRGGLPNRLDGMSMTCREQQSAADYQAARARLQQYSAGEIGADAVIAAPCDAAELTP